jgi:hypothetical protein
MRIQKHLALACLAIALSTTATAQFGVSGGGSAIPGAGTGGGGTWDTAQPPTPAESTVAVPQTVHCINSVIIDGLTHTWIGDLQAVLVDPVGVGHTIFVRPGYLNTSTAGNSGDFLGGSYTFIESGAPNDLPDTSSPAVNPPAGTYNQDFDTGGAVWTSGNSLIFNTPLSAITGLAGTWTLRIYDWAGGDVGSFSGWTLIGNTGCVPNSGSSDCDCSGGNSPCGNISAVGRGCPNSNVNGLGAMLTGSGNADTTSDTFVLNVVDASPNKWSLILAGTQSAGPFGISNIPNSAGVLCVTGQTARGFTVFLDGTGAASYLDFQGAPYGAHGLVVPGASISYTAWFRDPGTAAGFTTGGGDASRQFNFSNGWTATWQ